jgi:hypothetical protein
MVKEKNFFYNRTIFFFCSAEYERVNVELRLKISTLETVTANLKSGLIHSFQRKGGVDSKL